MKLKKIMYLFMFCALLVGCGSGEAEVKSSVEVKNDDPAKEEPKVSAKPKVEKVYIENGEMVVIDDFSEFTITDTKFAKKIEPPNPASFHTYYEAKEEGTTYLDTVITFKSLLTSGKSADEFASVEVTFDDKYEYRTFSIIEESGGSNFTFTNITSIEPLKNGTIHYLAEVPDEVESGTEPLTITVTINGKEYLHKVR